MKMFFEQAFDSAMVQNIMKFRSNVKVCFHKPKHVAVPWTHAHFYSLEDSPSGHPTAGCPQKNRGAPG